MQIPKKRRRERDDQPRVDAYGRAIRPRDQRRHHDDGARRDGRRDRPPRYDARGPPPPMRRPHQQHQRHQQQQQQQQHGRRWYGDTGSGTRGDHVPGAHGAAGGRGWGQRGGGSGRGQGGGVASSSRPGQQQQQRASKAKKAKSVWERHDLMPHALIRAIYKEGKVESAAVGEEGENGATLVKFHRYFFHLLK